MIAQFSFPQQTIRELFDVSEEEKKVAELSVPQTDDDESINKQHTTILEQVILNVSIWCISCICLFLRNVFHLLQTLNILFYVFFILGPVSC